MKTFEFYQDIKVTVWDRQFFQIEAENEQEAKRIAMKFRDEDVSGSMEYSHTKRLNDTEEWLDVEQNGGADTIQLYLRGEEHPFATNASDEMKMKRVEFDEWLGVEQVACRDMADVTVEATDHVDGYYYGAFHRNDKLHIVVISREKQSAVRYAFNENWDSLVCNNETFRCRMTDWLKTKYADSPTLDAEIHDWLAGHLTKMVASSDAVDDAVPFSLRDIITVSGGFATPYEYHAAQLIGYQIIDNDKELPNGLFSFQVIKDKQKALEILGQARLDKPDRNYNIYPVYEGDIEEHSFI